MRKEREWFFVCSKLDIYYSLNSIINWMAWTHSTRMQWWSRLFSKVEILAPNRLNISSLFYWVQWSPVQKETVDSPISGHHWGNNICPLIVGVLLLKSLIFLSSMFPLPREGTLRVLSFYNHSQDFWGKLLFSYVIALYGKSSTSAFWKVFYQYRQNFHFGRSTES